MTMGPGAILGRSPAEETLSLAPGQADPVESPRWGKDIHVDYGAPGQVLDLHGEFFHRHRVDPLRAQDPGITGPVIEGKKEYRPAAQGLYFPPYQPNDAGDHFPVACHPFGEPRYIQGDLGDHFRPQEDMGLEGGPFLPPGEKPLQVRHDRFSQAEANRLTASWIITVDNRLTDSLTASMSSPA